MRHDFIKRDGTHRFREYSFQFLEEVEADDISYQVFRKENKGWKYSLEFGYPKQAFLFALLINSPMIKDSLGDQDEVIKTLARLRTQEGGREEWCRLIGEALGKPADEQIPFALEVLSLIDSGVDQYDFNNYLYNNS